MPNILIVEDDININNLLCEVLRKAGYTCEQAFSGTEAKLLLDIKEKAYTLVLLDLMLPGASGEEVLKEIRKQGRLEFRDMVLIRSTFEVSIGGRVLPKITKQEFAILELLLKNPKQVFSKEDIFEYAWDEPYMGETKTLDVHISNIRKKIKTVTPDEYIETIWGIGYRLHE